MIEKIIRENLRTIKLLTLELPFLLIRKMVYQNQVSLNCYRTQHSLLLVSETHKSDYRVCYRRAPARIRSDVDS
ncbi:unnamed protein product [Arabidopsis halleri]